MKQPTHKEIRVLINLFWKSYLRGNTERAGFTAYVLNTRVRSEVIDYNRVRMQVVK